YLLIVVVAIYCVMSVSSLYIFHNDFFDFAFALVTCGFAIQGCVKIYVLLGRVTNMRKLFYTSLDFIKVFEWNERVCQSFLKYEKFCDICRPIVFLFYSISGGLLISFTIVLSIWTRSKLLPLGIVLPFLDYDSDIGYGINFSLLSITIIYGVIGIFASDYCYLCTMALACGQVETISILCNDLTNHLEHNRDDDSDQVQKMIRNIVMSQQLNKNYMNILEDCFGIHSLAIIVSSMISIAIALFVLIHDFWINGIMVIGITFWQISAICAVGGVYMIKVQKVEMEVNETKWYLLSVKKQKMFVNIIQNMQNPVKPSALKMVLLNFETLINCLKMMYQFLMLLLNMSK
uniref:Odorant receptor n=1 Tax=Phlebotomus papatasi TaxID=29031 RepID=A0A8W9BMR8_PHLPP